MLSRKLGLFLETSFLPWQESIASIIQREQSFITDYPVVDRIIRHLKLSFQAERPPPPQIAQQELLMAAEERGEYF